MRQDRQRSIEHRLRLQNLIQRKTTELRLSRTLIRSLLDKFENWDRGSQLHGLVRRVQSPRFRDVSVTVFKLHLCPT